MQIARDLSKKKAPRRSLVFAAVTAEELGLLGSRAYVADAHARGQHIVANLNTDMFLPLYPDEAGGRCSGSKSPTSRTTHVPLRRSLASRCSRIRSRNATGSSAAISTASFVPAFRRLRPRSVSSQARPKREIDGEVVRRALSRRLRFDGSARGSLGHRYVRGIHEAAGVARCEPSDGATVERHQRVRESRRALGARVSAETESSRPRIRDRPLPATRHSRRPAPGVA